MQATGEENSGETEQLVKPDQMNLQNIPEGDCYPSCTRKNVG